MLFIDQAAADDWRSFVAHGATHLIVGVGTPFDLAAVERLIAEVRAG